MPGMETLSFSPGEIGELEGDKREMEVKWVVDHWGQDGKSRNCW